MAKEIIPKIYPVQFTVYASDARYTNLIPKNAFQVIQDTLEHGLKKHPNGDGWEESIHFHLNRIVRHITLYHNGDKSENHLSHVFTRGMMINVIDKK